MPVVVDTSVTLAWFFEDETTPETEAALDLLSHDEAAVPALWRLEVANALLVAERRKRITEAQGARFLDALARLPIRVDDTGPSSAALVSVGRQHSLSAYDAAYLVLAERLGAPLATLDKSLATAAQTAGVALLF